MSDLSVPPGADPEVVEIAQYFDTNHLTHAESRQASMACSRVAQEMIMRLPHNDEMKTGLRKLLEAKDCFVRAALPKKAPANNG